MNNNEIKKNTCSWSVDENKRTFCKGVLHSLLGLSLLPSLLPEILKSDNINYGWNIEKYLLWITDVRKMIDFYNFYYLNNSIDFLKIDEISKNTLIWENVKKHAIKAIGNYDKKLSHKWKAKYRTLCNILNFPYYVLWGVWIKETKFDSTWISNAWAMEIFQIMPSTYKWLKKFVDNGNPSMKWEEWYFAKLRNNSDFMRVYNTDPKDSVSIAYLSYYYSKFWHNLEKTLRTYNSGNPNWYNKETNNYVNWSSSVIAYAWFFKKCLKLWVIV